MDLPLFAGSDPDLIGGLFMLFGRCCGVAALLMVFVGIVMVMLYVFEPKHAKAKRRNSE